MKNAVQKSECGEFKFTVNFLLYIPLQYQNYVKLGSVFSVAPPYTFIVNSRSFLDDIVLVPNPKTCCGLFIIFILVSYKYFYNEHAICKSLVVQRDHAKL